MECEILLVSTYQKYTVQKNKHCWMSILDWVSSHKGLKWDMLLMRRQIVFWGNAGLDQDITQWHQFLHPAGTSCIVSPHETGSVVHQDKPRAHCTSIRSNTGSKDLIAIPNGSQGVIALSVEDCVCVTHPPPNQSCQTMLQAE